MCSMCSLSTTSLPAFPLALLLSGGSSSSSSTAAAAAAAAPGGTCARCPAPLPPARAPPYCTGQGMKGGCVFGAMFRECQHVTSAERPFQLLEVVGSSVRRTRGVLNAQAGGQGSRPPPPGCHLVCRATAMHCKHTGCWLPQPGGPGRTPLRAAATRPPAAPPLRSRPAPPPARLAAA